MRKKRVIKIVGVGVCVIVLGIVVFIGINTYLMNRMISREIDALRVESHNAAPNTFSYQDLEGLPLPVQRYFRYVLNDGQKYITSVKCTSTGQFKLPFSETIFNVTAHEYFTPNPPALIFDAMFEHCPFWGGWVHVRDKYHHEKGHMYGNLFSGLNIFHEHDVKELDHDMFMRFVGNSVLFPTALLPSDDVRWEPLDDHSARLVVRDGKNNGVALVSFNDIGEIIQWETSTRYDRFEGTWRKVKQIGYRSNYQDISGIKVPLNFEIEKILPDGTHEAFWKGEITDIQLGVIALISLLAISGKVRHNGFQKHNEEAQWKICPLPQWKSQKMSPSLLR